jgi:cysteinyl-tRNA synthetase
LDWTYDSLDEAHKTLSDWYTQLEGVAPSNEVPQSILDAISDDLNTPAMIAELHKLFNGKQFPELLASLSLLGFSGKRERLKRAVYLTANMQAMASVQADLTVAPQLSTAQIEKLVADRLAARKAKNWKEADRIRDELAAMRVILKDVKNPATGEIETTWEIAR